MVYGGTTDTGGLGARLTRLQPRQRHPVPCPVLRERLTGSPRGTSSLVPAVPLFASPPPGVSTAVTFGSYQLLDFMSIGCYNQDGTDLLLASIAHVNADVLIAGPRLGYQLAGMPGTRPAPCT